MAELAPYEYIMHAWRKMVIHMCVHLQVVWVK